ncbi:MAG TPA: Pnap_2097 family protein [Polyangia bacterium]|nr:Pnap_2097 family protein [Polyangia bacterium]
MNPTSWRSPAGAPAGRSFPAPAVALPEAPRRVRVGMPQLDAGGLSEGWLLRDAGDRHWEAIARRLGVATDEIRSDAGERLYPTVVAARARYEAPLAVARENQVLELAAEVVPCGRACAHGRVMASLAAAPVEGFAGTPARFAIELLTTFAARAGDGGLRTTVPAPLLARRWGPVGVEPPIATMARAARRGERVADSFAGPALEITGLPLAEIDYQPSPYTDYNGAGLLYFAAYVTIADTLERRMVRRLWLDGGLPGAGGARTPDWALDTSPVRRDVFYYDNLPLGDDLRAALMFFRRDRDGVTTRVRISRAQPGGDGEARQAMADLVTRRIFVGRGGEASR